MGGCCIAMQHDVDFSAIGAMQHCRGTVAELDLGDVDALGWSGRDSFIAGAIQSCHSGLAFACRQIYPAQFIHRTQKGQPRSHDRAVLAVDALLVAEVGSNLALDFCVVDGDQRTAATRAETARFGTRAVRA